MSPDEDYSFVSSSELKERIGGVRRAKARGFFNSPEAIARADRASADMRAELTRRVPVRESARARAHTRRIESNRTEDEILAEAREQGRPRTLEELRTYSPEARRKFGFKEE